MKRKAFLFVWLFFFITFYAVSQELKRCHTPEYENQRESENPGLLKSKKAYNEFLFKELNKRKSLRQTAGVINEQIYRIPVVVHVVHNTKNGFTGGYKNPNISEEQILSQIQVLNEDYRKIPNTSGYNEDPVGADTKIEFCLASRDPEGNPTNGINRVYSDHQAWKDTEDKELKKLSYWPSNQYLNIWIADLQGGVIGYAQFPESDTLQGLTSPFESQTDGVVIDYECFGTTGYLHPIYNKGRTATHEIGHWLGLRHTWGDRPCGNDYVYDTPKDQGPNDDGDCSDFSDCDGDLVKTPDMTNNYMDYSPDECMNLFTQGQKTRMRIVLETNERRRSVINSAGCCGNVSPTPVPFYEDFETSSTNWEVKTPGSSSVYLYPSGASNSKYSQKIEPRGVFNAESNNSAYAYFISPYLTFKNADNPSVSFDLAYLAPTSSTDTDSLVISYQTNCGKWQEVITVTGEQLVTANRNEENFSPLSDDWKTFEYNVPMLANKSLGRIRFELYSKEVNNLYIDNVNIFKTTSNLSLTPYPNPARETISLIVSFEGERNIEYSLYSIVGSLILEGNIQKTKSLTFPIDVSNLAEGIYLIRVSDGRDTEVKRILVTK